MVQKRNKRMKGLRFQRCGWTLASLFWRSMHGRGRPPMSVCQSSRWGGVGGGEDQVPPQVIKDRLAGGVA